MIANSLINLDKRFWSYIWLANLFDFTLFLSLDEVAEFLSYVKTLDYDDKPDYQHLKDVLDSGVRGSLDFSVPQGPVEQSATKVADPHTGEKVRIK